MAAAITRHIAGDRVHVRSAGSQPGAGILPGVIEVLAEAGIEVNEEFPKPLTDDVVRAADAVVTMGCGDACPFYPGKHYLDWDLEDPAGKDLATVRRIRDEIRQAEEGLRTRA
jgi:protein-tyrosine-phosphatase